jgi:hypothetical protein
MSVTFLFLLRAQYDFNMEIELVTGHLNTSWFSSINMYDSRKKKQIEWQPTSGTVFRCCATTPSRMTNKTNRTTTLFAAARPSLLHPNLWKCHPQWSSIGRGRLLNLLHQALHHGLSTSLSLVCRASSYLLQILSVYVRSSVIYYCWGSHVGIQLSNHVLHIEHTDLCMHDLAR